MKVFVVVEADADSVWVTGVFARKENAMTAASERAEHLELVRLHEDEDEWCGEDGQSLRVWEKEVA